MWWTADPPRPFQLCPVPICSALRFLVAGLLPASLFIDVFLVYLKEPRIPLEPPLWYDRFFWQNPVRVTRPVPPGRCPFSSTLSTFRRVGLQVYSLSVRFRPRGLLLPFPVFRPSSSASGLATLSVLPAIPTLRLVGFCLTGDLSYYSRDWLSKR